MRQNSSVDDHLAQIRRHLVEMDARYGDWIARLEAMRTELLKEGMTFWEALDATSERRRELIASGDWPVDFDQLNSVLDELCRIYLVAAPSQREAIRGFFEHTNNVRGYLHSYIGRATRALESSGDEEWLLLALAAASIADRRVDWRDLLICLGELWFTAREAGFRRPGTYFSRVAKISNPEGRRGESSTRDLLTNFTKSAYFQTTKRRRADQGEPPLE